VPGYVGGVGGRGLGGIGRGFGGRGGGRGYRNRFFATGLNGRQRAATGQGAFGGVMPAAMSPDQQLDALKGQAEYFEDALEDIRKQIEELGGKARESDK
jgi:hypothetical protein